MKNQILVVAVYLTFCVSSSALLAESSWEPVQIQRSPSHLRSAILGPQQWGNQNLSPDQINEQLKLHFQTVLAILAEQTNASLEQSINKLEQQFGNKFTQHDRELIGSRLAARRYWQIRTLQHYAERGRFPLNEGQSGHAVPIFVDNHGTHCAVGYLMARSGHSKPVARIAQQNNLVYVDDVDSGPLVDWILFSGLTQAEAAMIQPGYAPPSHQAVLSDFQDPSYFLSHYGLTISNFTVVQYSFDGGPDFNSAFEMGVNDIATYGSAYSDPDNYGVSIGVGGWGYYESQLDNWVFLGPTEESGGSVASGPAAGDNSFMTWISYQVESDDWINQFGTASSAFHNANWSDPAGGVLQVSTQILTPELLLESQGTIASNPFEGVLHDSVFMSASGDQYWVNVYALEYSLEGFHDAAHFTSIFNEIQQVPEPAPVGLMLGLVGLTFAKRRRRE